MVALLWVLLALLALILVALSLPVHVSGTARLGPDPSLDVGFRLLGGLSPRIALPEPSSVDRPRERKARKPRDKARKRRGPSRDLVMRGLKAAPALVMGELRQVHVDRFRFDADFGLGDPAETGELYGWLCPLLFATPLRRADIHLRPDFTARRFDGQLDLSLHFTPILLAGPMLGFAWRVFVRR
jgi:hypothetical protein